MEIGIGLPNAVRGVDRRGIVGADEVICFPASHDPGQVGLLASAVGL